MTIKERNAAKLHELKQFLLRNGHCYVPNNKEYEDLYNWTLHIRRSRPRLSEQLVEELEALNFDWQMYGSREMQWLSQYYNLKEYKKRFGHCRVKSKSEEFPSLAEWVTRQRAREQKMPPSQKKLLNEIGFLWSVDFERMRAEEWKTRYEELKQFKEKFGHCNVPQKYTDIPSLAQWVIYQRRKEKSLAPSCKKLLEKIGFLWKSDLERIKEEKWQSKYNELKQFKEKFGHCNVPQKYTDIPSLALWVLYQRKNEKSLLGAQRKLLDKIGFLWKSDLERIKEEKWQSKYNELKQFKKKFGHCQVPITYTDNPSLAHWVQRLRKNEKSLPGAHRILIEKIGFFWTSDLERIKEEKWQSKYEELKQFKEKFGHCQVSINDIDNPSLLQWIRNQRSFEKSLPPARKKQLEKIGFLWTSDVERIKEEKWLAKYEELKQFKKKIGHCNVLTRYTDNTPLCSWVQYQRSIEKSLPPAHKKLLDKVGFLWKSDVEQIKEEKWKAKYRELKQFKKKFGHCNVPATYKDNPSLADWLRYQRSIKKSLPGAHRKLLEKIGLLWKNDLAQIREEKWQSKYEELTQFKKKFGHCHVPLTYSESYSLGKWVYNQRRYEKSMPASRKNLLDQIGFLWKSDLERIKKRK